MAVAPPARHLLRAKDLADPRYPEPNDAEAVGTRRGALPRPLQPRVQTRLRGVAALVSADPPAGASGSLAAQHGSLRRRHLPLGRPAEHRLLHDQLHAELRGLADR